PGDQSVDPAEYSGCRCWLDAADLSSGRTYVSDVEESSRMADAIREIREWQLEQAFGALRSKSVAGLLADPGVAGAVGRLLGRLGR
ncbi:MAG: hypothetical protein Q8Q14_10775, partial [Gemmatimonadales bacterium]|nr:hypothetical protein [Gemmatimonadales bacterium]